MNKKILLFLLMLLPLVASAQTKRTIHVATAGTLSNYISNYEKYLIEELTVTGELNGSDFRLIRDMAGIDSYESTGGVKYINTGGSLKTLDISNAAIVGGGSYYMEAPDWGTTTTLLYTQDNCISNLLFSKTKLESIIIPNNVTSIGYMAFGQCSCLTSIEIPNSVTTIEEYAFDGCSSLTTIISEIETPFVINDNAFYCSDKNIFAKATLIVPPGKKSAYQNTAGWNKFQNIVEVGQGGIIGQEFEENGIRYRIGENNNVSVISKESKYYGDVVIPEDIEYNGKTYKATYISGAFDGCSGLTSITIPSSLTRISEYAFLGCTNLTSVHISDLEAWCKIRCDYRGEIDSYTSNPLHYAHHLFLNGVEIKDLVIPNTVTSIGRGAFDGCSYFTSIEFSNSMTSIGDGAFMHCSGLTSLNIPNNIKIIEDRAFWGCTGLTSLPIPNSVTSIEGYAFYGCSGLTNITIPNSVTSIGYGVFQGCI